MMVSGNLALELLGRSAPVKTMFKRLSNHKENATTDARKTYQPYTLSLFCVFIYKKHFQFNSNSASNQHIALTFTV